MNGDARQRGLEGRVLGGLYRLGRVLGEGGMGVVYEATHEGLRRPVAVKVLSGAGITADAVARFQREAQAAALLGHPNIVQVTDFRVPSGGEPAFLVMEQLRGRPLEDALTNGPLSAARVARIGLQAAGALAAAHAAGIIHRDIKPSNLFLTEMVGVGEIVKVLDFGIAKVDGAVGLTNTGAVLGTPLYMAPEQAFGKPIDGRADVWSLGATLYHALTGRPPIQATAILELYHHLAAAEPLPSIRAVRGDLPPAFSGLIDAMLAKDANHRVPSMAAFIGALEPLLPQLGAPPVPLELQGTIAQTTPPMTPGPVRSRPPANSLAEASRETAGPLPQGPAQQLAYSPSAPYPVPLGVATTGSGGVAHTAAQRPNDRKFPVLVVSIPMLLAIAGGGAFLARRGAPATTTLPTAAAPSLFPTATNADAPTTLAPLLRPPETAPEAPTARRRTGPELPVAAIPSPAVPAPTPSPEPAAPAAQTGPGAFWAKAQISVGRSDAAQTYLETVTPRFTACGPGAELRRRAVPTDPEEYNNTFEVTLAQDGKVISAHAAGTTIRGDQCTISILKQFRFPAPPTYTTITVFVDVVKYVNGQKVLP
jgi:serine/threonine-protein kinase